jgi:RND family efflux transporter MFP subunit
MRKINHILTLTIISILLVACGGSEETSVNVLIDSGDLEAIRAKKNELVSQYKSLENEIAQLDAAISARTENSNLPLVTVFQAQSAEFRHFIELQGDVTTKQNVLVYPETAGTLIQVHVNEGDRVAKGQLLGTIDNGGMGSQLVQMKTQLALAETTYERQKRLWDQQIGSEIQYLQSKTNYEAQKSAVNQLESQLDKFKIRAPFSGIVDDIIKDQGTVVAPGPGSEVFRIVNLSNMYIEVLVPETYIASVVPGKTAKVHFPILNTTVDSKVKETGNYINPDNRSFSVKVPVPNKEGNIKPNLTAKVKINDYYQQNAILIPQSVVSENAEGEQYAYVVSDIKGDQTAVAKRKIIKTGKTQDGYVEVLDGISNGESIILEGARSVKDGQDVKILKK